MDPVARRRHEKVDERHRRSSSSASEEERRRRRRRRDRDVADIGDGRAGKSRDSAVAGRERGSVDRDDRYEDRGSKRRRSRSPDHQHTSRRREERKGDSNHSRRRDRSHDRSSKHGSRRDRSIERSTHSRSTKEDLEIEVSRKSRGPLPSQAAAFGHGDSTAVVLADDLPEKQKPNFNATGLLAAASNSVAAADGTEIVLKYHEPPEARKPPSKDVWKLFVFKGEDIIETIDVGLRSCWLIGRELAVVDLPAEHPSISKQHAVFQFRYIEKRNEYGDKVGKVKPYLIDLESANGTLLNKEPVQTSRYLELRDKDMIQFGHSTREYVLMLSPKF